MGNESHLSLWQFSSLCAAAHALPLVDEAWFHFSRDSFFSKLGSAQHCCTSIQTKKVIYIVQMIFEK